MSACATSGTAGWPDSTSPHRSRLVRVEARFFFDPGQLRRQAADLGIQVLHLLLVHGGCVGKGITPLEQSWEAFERDGFPFTDDIWMDTVLRRELVETLFVFQQLKHDLSLEGGC